MIGTVQERRRYDGKTDFGLIPRYMADMRSAGLRESVHRTGTGDSSSCGGTGTEAGALCSKRDQSLDLSALQQRFSPEDIVGLLAFLAGQIPRRGRMTPEELAEIFRWEKVPKGDIRLPADIL